MRLIHAIAQKWKSAAGATLTIALLSPVAVVGLTLFCSELLAVWKAASSAEQSLAWRGAFNDLLNFEAPTETMTRFAAKTEEAENSIQTGSDILSLVKNWRFTSDPPAPPTPPISVYITGIQLEFLVFLLQYYYPGSDFTNLVIAYTNTWLMTAAQYLSSLGLPPIPPISPFI